MWLTDNNIPIEKKAGYIIVGFCISPLIFMIIYSLFLPSHCETFIKDEFRGIVIKKYIDKPNHNNETIVIRKNGQEKLTNFVNYYVHDFYSNVNVNDSLIKKSGQVFISIKRHDSTFVYKMNYNCDNYLEN